MPKRRKRPPSWRLPIPILLQNSRITDYEIAAERDPKNQKQLRLTRDHADAELMRMARKGDPHALSNPRIRRQIAEIESDPKRARKAKRARTGRPTKAVAHFVITMQVADEIETDKRRRGAVERAIKAVAARLQKQAGDTRDKYETVREIWFARDPDAVRAQQALRKQAEWARKNPEAAERLIRKMTRLRPLEKSGAGKNAKEKKKSRDR
jgi:hypothetical protein